VEKVCKDVTTRARVNEDSPISTVRDSSAEGGDGKGRAPPAKHRSKSMSQVKEEHQQRVAAVRQAQAEEQQLGDFIRLADYMCVSNCYLLTLASCERLLEVLTTPRKNGLWITSVEFGEDDMVFSPPLKTFTASVTTMLELMVSNIHAVPRLLYMRPFKPYFQSGRVEGPDVAKLVRHATHWVAMQGEIEGVITQDFERATAYAQQFEEYRVIHVFGECWDFEAYADRMHTNESFKETVIAFKGDMAQLNRWFRELDRMRIAGMERNLHVDSKTLKNSLVPITQKALDKCRGLLLQVARDNNAEALLAYQQRMRDLGEQPRSLRDFADYCDNLNRVRAEAREMEEKAMQVNEMYDLLDAYEVKIPAADAVKKDDLKEAREALTARTSEAEGAVDGKMGQMTLTLEKSIANLNEELVGVLASLNSGDYVDPSVDPKLVLEKLLNVQEQLGAVSEKAEGYRAMQETFHVPVYEFKQLKDTTSQFELKQEMWSKLDSWNESVYNWKSAEFKELDVEEMIKECGLVYKDVHKMSKRPGPNGQPDPVVTMFKESVEDFKEHTPVINDLGNPSLQERHWKKIFVSANHPAPAL
jgi:dynein heavy chain